MANHLIQRQIFQVKVASKADANFMYEVCSDVVKYELPTLLDEVLSKLVPAHTHLRFQKVVLDLGNIHKSNFKTQLPKKIVRELANFIQIQQQLKSNELKRSSSNRSLQAALFFYLKYAYLPWWISSQKKFEINTLIQEEAQRYPKRLRAWLKKTQQQPQQLVRLCSQVNAKTQLLLLQGSSNQLNEEQEAWQNTFIQTFDHYQLSAKQRAYLYTALLLAKEQAKHSHLSFQELFFQWYAKLSGLNIQQLRQKTQYYLQRNRSDSSLPVQNSIELIQVSSGSSQNSYKNLVYFLQIGMFTTHKEWTNLSDLEQFIVEKSAAKSHSLRKNIGHLLPHKNVRERLLKQLQQSAQDALISSFFRYQNASEIEGFFALLVQLHQQVNPTASSTSFAVSLREKTFLWLSKKYRLANLQLSDLLHFLMNEIVKTKPTHKKKIQQQYAQAAKKLLKDAKALSDFERQLLQEISLIEPASNVQTKILSDVLHQLKKIGEQRENFNLKKPFLSQLHQAIQSNPRSIIDFFQQLSAHKIQTFIHQLDDKNVRIFLKQLSSSNEEVQAILTVLIAHAKKESSTRKLQEKLIQLLLKEDVHVSNIFIEKLDIVCEEVFKTGLSKLVESIQKKDRNKSIKIPRFLSKRGKKKEGLFSAKKSVVSHSPFELIAALEFFLKKGFWEDTTIDIVTFEDYFLHLAAQQNPSLRKSLVETFQKKTALERFIEQFSNAVLECALQLIQKGHEGWQKEQVEWQERLLAIPAFALSKIQIEKAFYSVLFQLYSHAETQNWGAISVWTIHQQYYFRQSVLNELALTVEQLEQASFWDSTTLGKAKKSYSFQKEFQLLQKGKKADRIRIQEKWLVFIKNKNIEFYDFIQQYLQKEGGISSLVQDLDENFLDQLIAFLYEDALCVAKDEVDAALYSTLETSTANISFSSWYQFIKTNLNAPQKTAKHPIALSFLKWLNQKPRSSSSAQIILTDWIKTYTKNQTQRPLEFIRILQTKISNTSHPSIAIQLTILQKYFSQLQKKEKEKLLAYWNGTLEDTSTFKDYLNEIWLDKSASIRQFLTEKLQDKTLLSTFLQEQSLPELKQLTQLLAQQDWKKIQTILPNYDPNHLIQAIEGERETRLYYIATIEQYAQSKKANTIAEQLQQIKLKKQKWAKKKAEETAIDTPKTTTSITKTPLLQTPILLKAVVAYLRFKDVLYFEDVPSLERAIILQLKKEQKLLFELKKRLSKHQLSIAFVNTFSSPVQTTLYEAIKQTTTLNIQDQLAKLEASFKTLDHWKTQSKALFIQTFILFYFSQKEEKNFPISIFIKQFIQRLAYVQKQTITSIIGSGARINLHSQFLELAQSTSFSMTYDFRYFKESKFIFSTCLAQLQETNSITKTVPHFKGHPATNILIERIQTIIFKQKKLNHSKDSSPKLVEKDLLSFLQIHLKTETAMQHFCVQFDPFELEKIIFISQQQANSIVQKEFKQLHQILKIASFKENQKQVYHYQFLLLLGIKKWETIQNELPQELLSFSSERAIPKASAPSPKKVSSFEQVQACFWDYLDQGKWIEHPLFQSVEDLELAMQFYLEQDTTTFINWLLPIWKEAVFQEQLERLFSDNFIQKTTKILTSNEIESIDARKEETFNPTTLSEENLPTILPSTEATLIDQLNQVIRYLETGISQEIDVDELEDLIPIICKKTPQLFFAALQNLPQKMNLTERLLPYLSNTTMEELFVNFASITHQQAIGFLAKDLKQIGKHFKIKTREFWSILTPKIITSQLLSQQDLIQTILHFLSQQQAILKQIKPKESANKTPNQLAQIASFIYDLKLSLSAPFQHELLRHFANLSTEEREQIEKKLVLQRQLIQQEAQLLEEQAPATFQKEKTLEKTTISSFRKDTTAEKSVYSIFDLVSKELTAFQFFLLQDSPSVKRSYLKELEQQFLFYAKKHPKLVADLLKACFKSEKAIQRFMDAFSTKIWEKVIQLFSPKQTIPFWEYWEQMNEHLMELEQQYYPLAQEKVHFQHFIQTAVHRHGKLVDPVDYAEDWIRSLAKQVQSTTLELVQVLRKEPQLEEQTSLNSFEKLVDLVYQRLTQSAAAQRAKAIQKQHSNPTEMNHLPEEGIIVHNAGLVILASFFGRYFKMLDLLEKRIFKDEEAAERAVHLLQYLVTRQSETPEHLLVFNKVLCGLPISTPISLGIELSEKEINTSEQMYRSVLANWPKMEKSSIENLRASFIIRNGLLQEKTDKWVLQVETAPFDIILEFLPWTISIINLPWMEKRIEVEWKTRN